MAFPNGTIDLRSDTVTRPTPGMRQAIAEAAVGDDMQAEDPTVNELEARMAELLGKEAAVYACSGTQSNQMGVWAHCTAGDELLIEESGHIANFEGGAPAILRGVTVRTLRGERGMLDLEHLQGKIRADNQHLCRTRLLCLENTTNLAGGFAYPLEQVERVCDWAHANGLATHLDGARLFNACIAGGYEPAELARSFDTISVCFSKGLGCPMGSILVGSQELIYHARRARKVLGGALRQAGIPAATALYALDHNIERLADDHAVARRLAEKLAELPELKIDPALVQTNLVFFEVDAEVGTAAQLAAAVKRRGVVIGAVGPQRLRACTHLDVNAADIDRAAELLAEVLREGLSSEDVVAAGPYARA